MLQALNKYTLNSLEYGRQRLSSYPTEREEMVESEMEQGKGWALDLISVREGPP